MSLLLDVMTSTVLSWIQSLKLLHFVYLFIGYTVWKCTYLVLLYPYLLSPLRKVPGPPLGNPLTGVLFDLITGDPGTSPRKWLNQYGPVVRAVGPVGLERLFFSSPEALERILVSGWLDFPRPQYSRNILGAVAGHGLLTVTGDEHKRMRKAIVPAFSIPNLMAQTDMYYDSIESLVAILRAQIRTDPSGSKVIPVYEWMGKATLDIICATAFGYHSDSLNDPKSVLAEAYGNLAQISNGPTMASLIAMFYIPYFSVLFRSKWLTRHSTYLTYLPFMTPVHVILSSMKKIKEISRVMLREKMVEADLTDDGAVQDGDMSLGGKRDVMSLLVRARRADARNNVLASKGVADLGTLPGGKQVYTMTDDEMVEHVLTFLGAGHETTASALTWTLWLLANDPVSQHLLREEVTPVLERTNSRPDHRALKNMTWLDCVLMESLRIMPPAIGLPRIAASDQYLDGVFVPKGTLIYIEIRAINTLKSIWGENAEEFHPDRWLNLPETYNSTFSMLTFITGPHGCIGKTMAIMEAKAVLASLIANFIFEPTHPGQVAQPDSGITMKPKDNMPLRMRCV